MKSCDRILEAQKIIILEKIEGDRIFSVIENIEEIRYALLNKKFNCLYDFTSLHLQTDWCASSFSDDFPGPVLPVNPTKPGHVNGTFGILNHPYPHVFNKSVSF